MPKNKDLKRLARSRMRKTGESYTTARAQLLRKKERSLSEADFAKRAGLGDDAVRAKTGRSWEEWVRVLDGKNAVQVSHREIAAYVHETFGISGWWAQTVTVGYERIRGLREIGQRRGGSYEASKSKTVSVSVGKLYHAFSDARTRARWLPEDELEVRKQTKDKSMRIGCKDGSSVDVYFTAKGAGKSQVAIQHRKLPSKADSERRKEQWGTWLAALAGILEGGS